MPQLLAIDPGPTESGFVLLDKNNIPLSKGKVDNQEVLDLCKGHLGQLAIEKIASYGMPVGQEVFETCVISGRFIQAYIDNPFWPQLATIFRPTRKEIVNWLCGTSKATDSNVRRALLDLYPMTGGGKTPQIGTKALPGPLYGFSKDMFAALAVGLYARSLG